MRLICATISATGAAALALAACSSNAADGTQPVRIDVPARHPVSQLPVVPLTVSRGKQVHRFRVEVARTSAEQAKGLMFRTQLGPDEGMIFPMTPPRQASFWMHNTVIPLDIIYVGADGRISNMWENTVPYSDEPLPSVGAVKGVLELRGGRAKQLGIMPGDKVEW